jgi:hypothetical protein
MHGGNPKPGKPAWYAAPSSSIKQLHVWQSLEIGRQILTSTRPSWAMKAQ